IILAYIVVLAVGQNAKLEAADFRNQVLDPLHVFDRQIAAAAAFLGFLRDRRRDGKHRFAVVLIDEFGDVLGADDLLLAFGIAQLRAIDILAEQWLDDG